MKLLTLNTHSLIEENYRQKLLDFVSAVMQEMPDIIALQEVNQTIANPTVPASKLAGYCASDENAVIRTDNHVFNVAGLFREKGVEYNWTWIPLKKGYDKYDEGIALMSRSPIHKTDILKISNIDDYNNWKTRKILGICTEEAPDVWFFSVHYGWWDDPDAPFQAQWERTHSHMQQYENVWLMGDFNSPAEVRDEGYDMIENAGWHDSFSLAEKKDSGITVGKVIDGWKDKITNTAGMRIDQIWCKPSQKINSSHVIFNGKNYPVVSDHYGIIVEV